MKNRFFLDLIQLNLQPGQSALGDSIHLTSDQISNIPDFALPWFHLS